MTDHKNLCKEIKTQSAQVLTLARLSQKTRETWPEYGHFDARQYFTWPTHGMFLYPNIAPMLSPEGCTTPVQLLQALVAKGALRAGSVAILVQPSDLEETHEHNV